MFNESKVGDKGPKGALEPGLCQAPPAASWKLRSETYGWRNSPCSTAGHSQKVLRWRTRKDSKTLVQGLTCSWSRSRDLKPAAAAWVESHWEPLHYSASCFLSQRMPVPQLDGTQNDTPHMDRKNLGADLRRVSKLSRTGGLREKKGRREGGKREGGGEGRKEEIYPHSDQGRTLKCQGLIPEEEVWNGMSGNNWRYCFKQRTYLYTMSSVKLLTHWHM